MYDVRTLMGHQILIHRLPLASYAERICSVRGDYSALLLFVQIHQQCLLAQAKNCLISRLKDGDESKDTNSSQLLSILRTMLIPC
jgi:hypothetical protein